MVYPDTYSYNRVETCDNQRTKSALLKNYLSNEIDGFSFRDSLQDHILYVSDNSQKTDIFYRLLKSSSLSNSTQVAWNNYVIPSNWIIYDLPFYR